MILDDKKFIGKIIRQYRQKKKLTQAQLAEKTDLSEKHLGQIEREAFYPTIPTFFKIVKVLNINLNDFGITCKEFSDRNKNALIKMIYSASEEDLEMYLDLLNALNKHITKSKVR